jgi:putative transposase
MRQVITAKLKLQTTPDQFKALRRTQLVYRDALNHVSRYAYAHGKMSNQQALQRACYEQIRLVYCLPAQMACNVPRQVGATYKTLWTKVKANLAARQAGRTKKRYKGLDQPPKYVSPTLTYNYHRDYSLKAERRVSILTLEGRVIAPYAGYARHMELLQRGAQIGAAKLWYDKPRKQFYLLVSLEVQVPDPTPATHQRVVGVDVGQRYLAVATDMQDNMKFFPGTEARASADHYARLRKRLQRKGARSATRRLIVIAGQERRLSKTATTSSVGALWMPTPTASSAWKTFATSANAPSGGTVQKLAGSSVGPTGMHLSGPSRSCMVTWHTRRCWQVVWL